jgi:hypothetical protein
MHRIRISQNTKQVLVLVLMWNALLPVGCNDANRNLHLQIWNEMPITAQHCNLQREEERLELLLEPVRNMERALRIR